VLILDAHAHCGLTLPFEKLQPYWEAAQIDGGVLFAPVEEIYDRYDYSFTDSQSYRQSRKRVHAYLETLQGENIFTYWFVWNDFAFPPDSFKGIKWHRHSSEPEYNYSSEKFEPCLNFICNKKLPIIIEEEFHYTLKLLQKINRRTVAIIPHFGMLNGGYARLKQAGVFENTAVYVDTALAGSSEIKDFAHNYGPDRILFGSDFPFGIPAKELTKVKNIFSGAELKKVLGENLLALNPLKNP
jgi:hypothetical protein